MFFLFSGNIMNTSLKEKRTKGLVVQIPLASPFISMHPDNITVEGGGDVYRGGDSSTAGVTRLQRRGLVYRGQDSSTDREACLRRWRLV